MYDIFSIKDIEQRINESSVSLNRVISVVAKSLSELRIKEF